MMTRIAIVLMALVAILPESSAAKPLNLLVIQTDEHNYRTLGCYRKLLPKSDYYYGKDVVKTPNIDWIADNGAICTSFYATTPVCSPSRGALVSGRYPQNTPVVQNNVKLGDDVVTFAEILRRQGYATGYAGKWHLDGFGKPQWGPERKFGFEDNRFMFNRGHWKNFGDTPEGPKVGTTDKKGQPGYGVGDADEKTFSTDWLADKVVDFIDANRSKPFCYMVSFPDPHGPNTVRAPYDTKYNDITVPTPDSTLNKTRAQTPAWGAMAPRLTADTVRSLMPKYFGMVECLDDNIGKILDRLRQHGILENTVIVFTSDHGDLCGEHGRLNKGVPYEGSARVPFLLYNPGNVKSGTVINQSLSCVNFLPTVLDLMGQKTAGLEQGRNAASLFRGTSKNWNDVSFIRSTAGNQLWLMAASDDLKLVFASQGKPWLFDLKTDPDELNNQIENPKHRDQVRRLSRQLLAYAKKFEDPYVEVPRISADLKWAIGRSAKYVDPEISAPAPKQSGKQGNRKNRNKKKQ
ncbi:MAG: sulfatase-like hydrolase/transferase [Verrucomicrobiia bacterium]|jgi:arylsulfatase A-like enzyme